LAAPLGLQKGDVVVTLNGKNVASWAEVDAGVMDSVFDKAPILLTWRSASGEVRSGMIDTQTLDIEKGQGHAEVGLSYVQAAAPRIADVLAGPARDAGLQKNDVIVAANGQPVSSRDALTAILTAHIGQAIALDVRRGDQPLRVMLTPAKFAYSEVANGQSVERVIGRAGVALSMADVVVKERGVFASVGKGFEHMWRLARYNLKGLYKIATGQMSLKNIGGPIKTAKIVGESVQHGFREFMARIAFVSIGLGVLNLLPIPVLDGGHFFTYLIEAVRRKPVSEKVLLVAQKVGLLMLLAFMTLAFYNDALDLFS
jgi:regulator of sigma E protease